MPEELIDIINDKNQLINKTTTYKIIHQGGLWHRAAHVWLYNSRGEILLQLRSKQKYVFPNMWDISAAGHISAGEEPLVSAQRELAEELGLKSPPENFQLFKIQKEQNADNNLKENEFCYIYLLKYDDSIKKLKLQKEEVAAIKFIAIEKFAAELKSNPQKYVPHNYYKELLAGIKKQIKHWLTCPELLSWGTKNSTSIFINAANLKSMNAPKYIKQYPKKQQSILPIFLVVFIDLVGLGIIIPILATIFIRPDSGILPLTMPESTRCTLP